MNVQVPVWRSHLRNLGLSACVRSKAASKAGWSGAILWILLLLGSAAPALNAAAGDSTGTPVTLPGPYKQPQVAVSGRRIGVTWGTGNSIFFSKSMDGGRTFSSPVTVSEAGVLSLGMHRGPRLVMTPSAIVISAVYGGKGKGADGDLLAFRSLDGGASWSKAVRVNDREASAREGLHAMAADGNTIYADWLDDRGGNKELYGASSTDGGATWSPNRLIYHSPDGHICECCHPSVAVRGGGTEIYAMFRNWLGGSRDLYLASSNDGGRTFTTTKLGQGTWPLEGCPMDGGGVTLDARGPLTVWRRGSTVFEARPGAAEIEIGPGKNAAIAGDLVVWSAPDGLRVKRGSGEPTILDPTGAYPSAAGAPGYEVVAWEAKGGIAVRVLSSPLN